MHLTGEVFPQSKKFLPNRTEFGRYFMIPDGTNVGIHRMKTLNFIAMKNVKKVIALLMAAGIISLTANAQQSNAPTPSTGSSDYNTAIGARFGGLTSGLTVKHFTNPNTALEGILSFGYNSFLVTGLYEKHVDIPSAEGLKWLYGIGGHVGFFRYRGYYYWVAYDNGNRIYYVSSPGTSAAVAGLDFILGLDYKFRNAPFSVGLDTKPFIDFYNGTNGYFDGALSVRFAF